MKKLIAAVILFVTWIGPGWSQSTIGLPAIRNFRNTDYHAALEVSDVCQDRRGLLYFANNDGLLTYNGAYWKLYPLPNKAAVKSLAMDAAGRIYVGGQDEVGYFFPDRAGILEYHSLKENLPVVARQFADIWNIVVARDAVYFRTIESIFCWKDGKMTTYDAPGGWQLMTQVDSVLFAADKVAGLQVLRDGQWRPAVGGIDGGGGRMMGTGPGRGRVMGTGAGGGRATGTGPGGGRATGTSTVAALHITGIAAYSKDTLLVATSKNGLYLLSGASLIHKPTPADGQLTNNLINTLRKIGQDRYAIGTSTGGVFILNGRGDIIQHYSGAEGLGSNNVLCVGTDRESNLWLGLENGISFIHYNTSVKRISPVRDNQLLCNAVGVYGGRLYVGTFNGLYSVGLDPSIKDMSALKGNFTEVANTKGRVWSLAELDGSLLMGHQDGAYVIRDDKAAPIMTRQGVWGFVGLPGSGVRTETGTGVRTETGSGVRTGTGSGMRTGTGTGMQTGTETRAGIVAGTYTGLQGISFGNGQFREVGKVNDLYESLPGLAADSTGTVWASHPYRGVFRNPAGGRTYSHYGVKEGLPSTLNNSVHIIRGRCVVTTEKGVYAYDEKTDRFIRSAWFEPIFHDTSVEYLREDKTGSIWFVSNRRVGVIDTGKPGGAYPYTVVYFPELTDQTVKGSAYIYPYDRENIFIGGNNGVFHLNYSRYIQEDNDLSVMLSTVKAIAEKDSLVYGGYAADTGSVVRLPNQGSVVRLPNHWNSFHFEYSSPFYAQQSNVEFSYRLEGFDRDWSGWTTRTEKDYTNLPYGQYSFSVRGRDNLGNISAPAVYSFIVNPAWYQTVWAWLLYAAAAGGLIYAVRKAQLRRLAMHRKKYEEEQERRNYLHSLELDRKEKGLIALQNEKLADELQFKNKELATVTMHLVERGGITLNIKEELHAVIKKLNIPNLSYEFRSVFRMIGDTEKSDEDWNKFALYFDQVHNNFLTTLKAKSPQLSPTDLKLCAYLRLNLTSKEIAQILNISLKGVEVSRYRLRKKLNLSTEVNLYDYLIGVTGE